MLFSPFSHLAVSEKLQPLMRMWPCVLDALVISSFLPFSLPPPTPQHLPFSFHRFYSCASHLFTHSLPDIYFTSHPQWLALSRDAGLRVIFSRIITHSDVSPLILPTDPNSSFSTPMLSSFPSLLSALLNQGALTIALERQFFNLILRPVVMEIGLFIHHHSPPHTWNMNDEFEVFLVCVCACVQACVYVSVGGGNGF